MTYEEFNRKAMTQRSPDSPTIFLVEVVSIADLPGKKRQHYPRYRTSIYSEALANTLEEAEALIMADVARRKEGCDEPVFCYYVTEKPLGKVIYRREYFSKRMYDARGMLQEKSYCSSLCYTEGAVSDNKFYGHPGDTVRFNVGDIVAVCRGDEVSLAVVVGTPPSVERCREIFNRCEKRGEPYPLDDTDDCYTVIDGPGYSYHDHISTLNVFAPHFPVPPYMERRLNGYMKSLDE